MGEEMTKIVAVVHKRKDGKVEPICLDSKYLAIIEENTLVIKDNSKYISGFYAKEINSLKCVVGENGAGKTTFIKSILELFSSSNTKSQFITLAVFETEGQFNYVCLQKNITNRFKVKYSGNRIREINELTAQEILTNDLTAIFYSGAVEGQTEDKITGIENKTLRNVSNSFLLSKSTLPVLSKKDMWQHLLFSSHFYDKILVKLKLPKKFKLKESQSILDYKFFFRNYSKVQGLLKKVIKLNYYIDKTTFSSKHAYSALVGANLILITKLIEFIPETVEFSLKHVFFEELNKICEQEESTIETIFDYFYNESTNPQQSMNAWNEYKKMLKLLSDLHGEKSGIQKKNERYIFSSELVIDLSLDKNRKWVHEFLKYSYFQTLFDVEWDGISSGEFGMVNLFSRLHKAKEQIDSKHDVCIFIDEVDLGFHPEWQRRLINIMPTVIQEIFADRNIQILISTHSPLLLSDVREDDIILLSDKNDILVQKNFGTNINQILSEQFFLKEGLIGEFSKKKINEYLMYLKSPQSALPEEKLIEIDLMIKELGEVVLRKELERLLFRYKLTFDEILTENKFEQLLEILLEDN